MRNRAPFIWTPKQPIDQMAMLSVMAGTKPRAESANRWFLFRRTFELAEVPGSAPLHITVDGRYQLFVNGTRIGRGPARCSPLYQRYDSYDVGAALMPGANSIAVLVRVFGKDMSWYEQTKGMWQPTFGDGGLWVATDLAEAGADGALTTDTEWRCIEADAWNSDTPQANHGLGFIEDLDARRLPEDWTATGYDDAGWDAAQIMQAGGGGPEAFFGGMRTVPFPVLQPNTISPLAETELRPERIAWTKSVEVRDEAPLHDQIYTEPLSDPDADAVKDVETLLNAEGRTHITTAPGRGVSILFDFGRITTIHPFIEIEAKGGEQIDIAVAERLPDEWTDGGPAADSRIARTPLLGLDAHLSRYTARPGRQRFERFEWQAAKWMQVTIRNAPEGVDILSLGGLYTRFGTEARGRFDCSDPVLNRLWETGRYTLQLCMHDGWEDCPSREQRQWLGDATVENLVGHAAFGPGIADLNAEFLRKAAESQRPDGLTQMFAPGNHGDNGILIPDWTLQWILNARDHAVWTGDLGVIEEIFPAIERALAWFARLRNENGLVADMPYWHFMDWSGVGRAGEACTLNAQLAGCLDAAATLADQLQMPRKADTYRADANAIRHALDRRHWNEARGVYVDMVDPENGEQNPRVSQHANAAMILWGDAPADRWPRMIDYISDPERITFTPAPPIANDGEALDEATGVVMANTFYSHFVYEALAKAGRTDRAFAMIRRRYGDMLAAGATTLWESFGPTASLCHGFSASPTWQMSSKILGVMRDPSGPDDLDLAPDLLDLDHASGTVPLREGDVDVDLKRTDAGFTAKYRLPEGLKAAISIPDGHDLAGPLEADGTDIIANFVRAG